MVPCRMGAYRLLWEGEDRSFARGRLVLTEQGITFHGHTFPARLVIVIDDGHFIVRDGEIWVDPSKKGVRPRSRTRFVRRRHSMASTGPRTVLTTETICAIYLFLLYPQAICLLLALFYGTSVLGHELDGKTLTYLFTRSLPRWKFVLGKYLGIVTALILPTSLSLLGSWLILGAVGGLALFMGALVGTVGALLAYNAVFVLFGFLIPRRAMIVALLYGIIFELVLSFVPALVNQLTITYYLRSLVVEILDLEIPREMSRIVGGASVPLALLSLAAIITSALVASSFLAARKEFVVSDQA